MGGGILIERDTVDPGEIKNRPNCAKRRLLETGKIWRVRGSFGVGRFWTGRTAKGGGGRSEVGCGNSEKGMKGKERVQKDRAGSFTTTENQRSTFRAGL